MASLSRGDCAEPELLLILARIVGDRAVYGALVDTATHPGTIRGVVGPLRTAASRRQFLAGAVPTDPARAAWGQRQCWDFPVLGMRWAPVLGNETPDPESVQPALPKKATYQQEYVRCGKPTCTRCCSGPGHGPYWYAYWREGGRLHKRYLGKTPPQLCSAEGGDALPST
jgi:hypothetical protein